MLMDSLNTSSFISHPIWHKTLLSRWSSHSKSKLKLLYDWRSVSMSVCFGVGHPFGVHDQTLLFPFFCRTIALLFVLGRPVWREDGSVICSAICQWSELRRTHNRTLLSHLRIVGSLSVASYDSQGLRRKYSCLPFVNLTTISHITILT
jgi:hypothetical protein